MLRHVFFVAGATASTVVTHLRQTADAEPSAAAEARAGGPIVALHGGITLRISSNLEELEPLWRAFQREAEGTVFQTFDWLSKWQRHIGARAGTLPVIVTGTDTGGTLFFLFPLAIDRRHFVRRLTWLGAQLCDYNGPLLRPGFADRICAGAFPALWDGILRLLRADPRYRFDYIDLPKMPEQLGGQPNPLVALKVHPNPSGAYVATLGSDWEAFYASRRSGPTRKKERKQLKQLAEHGDIRFISAADATAIPRSMEALIAQKSRAFARMGVTDNFARPGYRDFYLDLATDPQARDIVHVSRLDVGDVMAATGLGLCFGGSYYLVLSSYDDGALARFGPGRAHLHELIRHAIARGLARFDFTIGDELYKRDWSDVVLKPYDHLRAVTLGGAATVTAMTLFRVAKRFIKQTPVLWRIYSRARSLKASWSMRGAPPAGSAEIAE